MSVATIGGILLILGAWFTYRGNIYFSIILYFVADICWFIIAFNSGDILGSGLVALGMLLGIGVFIKMNLGIFAKSLEIK